MVHQQHHHHQPNNKKQQQHPIAGLYDTTALPITPSHPPSSHAPHVLFMVLLTCVYNVDALGGLLPEHSKQPDAEALVRGLALVLRHVGGNASQVCPHGWCLRVVFECRVNRPLQYQSSLLVVVSTVHTYAITPPLNTPAQHTQELASLVSQCVRTLLQASNVISSRTSMDLGYRRQAGTLAAMMQGVGRAHNHKNHNILNTWTSNFVARGA